MADPSTLAQDPVLEPAPTAPAKDVLASLAGQIKHAKPGTYARLRRFDPSKYPNAAVFETEGLLHMAQVPLRSDEQHDHQRWALVLHCLAITQGAHDGRSSAEPGAVLAALRFSEARLQQLVEASYPVLVDLMPRLARRLAAAGVAVNWWPLAELMLYTDTAQESIAQQARRRLVRTYLQSQRQSSVEGISANATAAGA